MKKSIKYLLLSILFFLIGCFLMGVKMWNKNIWDTENIFLDILMYFTIPLYIVFFLLFFINRKNKS